MPEVTQTLRRSARAHNIRLDIVEKDYALSYLLAAITRTAGLGDHLALKGGTALRKVYYPDYRFSEDLDYSTLTTASTPGFTFDLAAAVQHMRELLNQRGPFEAHYEPLLLRQPHPGRQTAFLVRVQFPGQREAPCRLKVEITTDEPVLLPLANRRLLHGFDEPLSVTIQTYALAEIVAEKLRALLQSRARLAGRGWGASRVCRDYYDLWSVLTRESTLGISLPGLVHQKCVLRDVTFHTLDDFFAPDLFEVARREWGQQVLPFVPTAPPVEQVLTELRPRLEAHWA